MTDILIAFVIPILVIIAAAILQSILHNPFKVTGIIFIALIITAFALGATTTLLVLAWVYTILAFVVAWVTCRCFRWELSCNCEGSSSSTSESNSCTCESSSNSSAVANNVNTINTSSISNASSSINTTDNEEDDNNASNGTCLRYWR